MPRVPSSKKPQRHNPLERVLDPSTEGAFRSKPHAKPGRAREDEADVNEQFVSGKMSKKLMKAVADQRKELEEEAVIARKAVISDKHRQADTITDAALLSGNYGDEEDDDDYQDADEVDYEPAVGEDNGDYDYAADVEMSEADRAALEMFMPKQTAPRANLSDLIMQKIKERETAASLNLAPAVREGDIQLMPTANPQVINTYRKLGKYLNKYRSGTLGKAFKFIPRLPNWEEILYYTSPMDWSPQATNAAVRFLSATLSPKRAQRFYSLVLVPKVQAMVEAEGKLNYHMYDAVKRAIYKPTAFFKGIILPLAAQGCSSKEAICYASVLSKISIPNMHAAMTLLQLARMSFNSVQCLFMRVLINKKFALPLPVISAITEYFFKTIKDDTNYPVLWFRTLLTFVQRYKYSLTVDQSAMLKALVKKKHHHLISDEVRRELIAASGTGPIGTNAVIDDSVMM